MDKTIDLNAYRHNLTLSGSISVTLELSQRENEKLKLPKIVSDKITHTAVSPQDSEEDEDKEQRQEEEADAVVKAEIEEEEQERLILLSANSDTPKSILPVLKHLLVKCIYHKITAVVSVVMLASLWLSYTQHNALLLQFIAGMVVLLYTLYMMFQDVLY